MHNISVVTINPHTLKLHRICSSLPFQLVCVAEIKALLLPRILGVLFIFHYGFVRARQFRQRRWDPWSRMTFARAPDTPVTSMEMWAERRIDTYCVHDLCCTDLAPNERCSVCPSFDMGNSKLPLFCRYGMMLSLCQISLWALESLIIVIFSLQSICSEFGLPNQSHSKPPAWLVKYALCYRSLLNT